MKQTDPIVIVAAARTDIGTFNGSLATVAAHDLGAVVIRQSIADSGLDGSDVDEVIMGQVLTAAQRSLRVPRCENVLNTRLALVAPLSSI